jgi:2-polyprenyl-3-methyl-5-hydroxy-6-metoxy-1,4-benzoquinol methylase
MSIKLQHKKTINCPLCKKRKTIVLVVSPEYKLVKCKYCGMIWDPKPYGNLDSLYRRKYFINQNPKGGYSNYFEGMKINKKTFHERLLKIKKRVGSKGKLLDVGCALGDCLVEAKKLGWKHPQGLEISKYAYRFAQKRGLDVKQGSLKSSSFKPNTFDVVLYQDVIEHLVDPLDELATAKKILKPNGLIFLVTPNVEGYWAKLLGTYWYHYKPNEHISYFSETIIKLALEKAGYSSVEVKKTYHVLSLGYVLNRLRYYSPNFFAFLLKIIGKTSLADFSFRAYIGELEAWGQKTV